ncbi:hypothetical protein D9M68_285430 [compost metagenome]
MPNNARSMIFALLALSGLATTTIATAARGDGGGSTYQQEIAVCGHNQQDRAACIREAGPRARPRRAAASPPRPTTAPTPWPAAACSRRPSVPTARPACWAAQATSAAMSMAA